MAGADIRSIPTDEDCVLVAAGCSLDCRDCAYSNGRAGLDPAEALSRAFVPPLTRRLIILAGDVVRADIGPLVARARERGSEQVVAYLHPGIGDPRPLSDLAAEGLTGIRLLVPAASRSTLALMTGGKGRLRAIAALIDAARALSLSIEAEIPVSVENWPDLADTLRRVLFRAHGLDRVLLRFGRAFHLEHGGPPGFDPALARHQVQSSLESARAHGVTLQLVNAPPPCVLDLGAVHAENYPGIGSWSHGAPATGAAGGCAAGGVCGRVAVPDIEARVCPGPPVAAAGLAIDLPSSVGLFLRQDALDSAMEAFRRGRLPPCRLPWEQVEAHDARGIVTPCAGGWPREEAVALCESWRDRSLLDAWNSPGMQAFRNSMASGSPGTSCKPECPTFHGASFSAPPPPAAPSTRRFLDNLVTSLREMAAGASTLESRPLSISFSPTLRCPNRCRMCDIHDVRKALGDGPDLHEMPDDLYEQILELLPTTRMLALTGGEPLVSRRVRTLLREFSSDRYPDGAVTLTTNGLLLRGAVLGDLLKVRLRLVHVSLNAATAGTYEAITGTRGGFERVLANCRRLLESTSRSRTRVALSFVVMRSNYRELPAFLDLAARMGAGVRLLPVERDRCGESIFTDEGVHREVSRVVRDEATPRVMSLPWSFRDEVWRLESILRLGRPSVA